MGGKSRRTEDDGWSQIELHPAHFLPVVVQAESHVPDGCRYGERAEAVPHFSTLWSE